MFEGHLFFGRTGPVVLGGIFAPIVFSDHYFRLRALSEPVLSYEGLASVSALADAFQ